VPLVLFRRAVGVQRAVEPEVERRLPEQLLRAARAKRRRGQQVGRAVVIFGRNIRIGARLGDDGLHGRPSPLSAPSVAGAGGGIAATAAAGGSWLIAAKPMSMPPISSATMGPPISSTIRRRVPNSLRNSVMRVRIITAPPAWRTALDRCRSRLQ